MATIRQKKAFKEVVENGSPVSAAMVKVGYSKNTAVAPSKLTRSKGWEELMDKHLPDRLLAKKHREGLNAVTMKPRMTDRDEEGRPVYSYEREVDYSVRHKYLDSAYKLKGRYAEPESGNTINILVLPSEVIERHGVRTNGSPEEDSQRQAQIQGS